MWIALCVLAVWVLFAVIRWRASIREERIRRLREEIARVSAEK